MYPVLPKISIMPGISEEHIVKEIIQGGGSIKGSSGSVEFIAKPSIELRKFQLSSIIFFSFLFLGKNRII